LVPLSEAVLFETLPWPEPVAEPVKVVPRGAEQTPAPALPSYPELVPVQVPQLELLWPALALSMAVVRPWLELVLPVVLPWSQSEPELGSSSPEEMQGMAV
jgi:hypothetical protein